MGYCVKCGIKVDESMQFCPACGAKLPKIDSFEQQKTDEQYTYQYTGQTSYHTYNAPKTVESGMDRFLAVLSYLGILVVVPILAGNDSKFVKFHANQGLVLFLVKVIWRVLRFVLSHFLWFMNVGIISLGTIFNLMEFGFLILTIIGIVNALKSEKKELPIIGDFVIWK